MFSAPFNTYSTSDQHTHKKKNLKEKKKAQRNKNANTVQDFYVFHLIFKWLLKLNAYLMQSQ